MKSHAEQLADFRTSFPKIDFEVIFDVGANVGQSSQSFRKKFSLAKIYSFEPVTATYDRLKARHVGDKNMHCYNLALGEARAKAQITARLTKTTNRIVDPGQPLQNRRPTIEINVETGDQFCQDHGITRINFLKIDTEGYDLKVCQGFAGMLSRGQIDLLQVEVSMHPDNVQHVPFETFRLSLQDHGYHIFKIYDQSLYSSMPQLRRANVVFVSASAIQRNTKTTEAELNGL